MDWAKHFQNISKDNADFGSILGKHTAHELAVDGLNWQGFVTDMATHIAENYDSWQTSDPNGWTTWKRDWDAFLSRWDTARAKAEAVVISAQNSMLGWDYTTAESDYQALAQTFQNGQYPSPGGFDDLYRRWVTAGKAPVPNIKVTIDPNAAPDLDIAAYKASDTILKAVTPTNPFAAMPLWEKVLWGVGALVSLGIVIKVAK
jgi:hypothetical protein